MFYGICFFFSWIDDTIKAKQSTVYIDPPIKPT